MTKTNILVLCAAQGKRVAKALSLIQLLHEQMKHQVTVHTPGKTSFQRRISDFLGDRKVTTSSMIIYLGTGTENGWQVTENEFYRYSDLVFLLRQCHNKRRISILNDTHHSQRLMKHLIGERSPEYTSCFCHPQCSIVIGTLTSLALECWSQGLRPEQNISCLVPGHLGSYHNLPIWQRWGELFEDQLFRPTNEEPVAKLNQQFSTT
jgi:hypothetical protein